MADPKADGAASAGAPPGRRDAVRKIVVALLLVLVAQALFALTLVSALQLLVLRDAPFGMVGSSQVIAQAQSTVSLDITAFPNESAAMEAVNHGRLYGVYLTGDSSDTLVVVPSKISSARSRSRAPSSTPRTSWADRSRCRRSSSFRRVTGSARSSDFSCCRC